MSASGGADAPVPRRPLPLFVAVHAGAGYHAPATHATIGDVLATACRAAHAAFGMDEDSRDDELEPALAVAWPRLAQTALPPRRLLRAMLAAAHELEASPWTNAGIAGASLTEDGACEVDASVAVAGAGFPPSHSPCPPVAPVTEMVSPATKTIPALAVSRTAAIGAAPDLAHPVAATVRLLLERAVPPLPGTLYRVPPLAMAGAGATAWARQRGLALALGGAVVLITEATRAQWRRYAAALAAEAAAGAVVPSLAVAQLVDTAAATTHATSPAADAFDADTGSDVDRSKRRRVTQPPASAGPVDVTLVGNNHGTVGVLVYDGTSGWTCAATSSGGIWYEWWPCSMLYVRVARHHSSETIIVSVLFVMGGCGPG